MIDLLFYIGFFIAGAIFRLAVGRLRDALDD